MKRLLLSAMMLFVCSLPAFARGRTSGWCQDGGYTVSVPGGTAASTNTYQRSFASCIITVYLAVDGTTIATLYSDDAGTARANPFTADAAGQWFFYADDGRYNVRFSGGGIATPFTLGDFQLLDANRPLNGVEAATQAGADCGARINTADSLLGGTPGVIFFDQRCGTTWSTAVVLTSNHVLRCTQGGTYILSAASPQITFATSGGISGDRACVLQMSGSTNRQKMLNVPETALDVVIEGITIDGNRANNAGSYPNSQGLIWVGSTAAAAEDVRLTIRNVRLMNPQLEGIYGQHVSGVSVEDVVATGIGDAFIYGQDCGTPCPASGWKITGNRFDYSQRRFVGTITTNGTTTVTGSGFNTNWGTAGYDAVMHLSGGGNYTISSCASATTCTLTAAVTDPNGAYVGAVGQGIGIYYTNLNDSVITDNRAFSLPNGALEAVNIAIGDRNVITGNRVVFPASHTSGAEGITLTNAASGGSFSGNIICHNTIIRPASTGITIQDLSASATPLLQNNIVCSNTIIDANALDIGPGTLAGGFDNGIRITGSGVDGTVITGNNCISTVTGAADPRRGFDVCVAIDNNGDVSTRATLANNWFTAADTAAPTPEVYRLQSGTDAGLTNVSQWRRATNSFTIKPGTNSTSAVSLQQTSSTPYATFDSTNGGLSVGATFAGVATPANSAMIQNSLGVGPQSATGIAAGSLMTHANQNSSTGIHAWNNNAGASANAIIGTSANAGGSLSCELINYGAGATGTTVGLSNASLGVLQCQNGISNWLFRNASANLTQFSVNDVISFLINPSGPQMPAYTFAALPGATNGTVVFCSNCTNVVDNGATAGATCAGAGGGAIARRENGHWACN